MASDDLKGIFFPRKRGAAQPFRRTKGKQSRDVSEVPDVKKKKDSYRFSSTSIRNKCDGISLARSQRRHNVEETLKTQREAEHRMQMAAASLPKVWAVVATPRCRFPSRSGARYSSCCQQFFKTVLRKKNKSSLVSRSLCADRYAELAYGLQEE